MAPFGSGHTVLDGNSTPDSPKGATMPRTGAILATLAVVLVAAGCGGDQDRAPADPVVDAGPDRAVSEVDPIGDASPEAPAASEAEPSEYAVADTTSVRLGDRFAWCARVQALWDTQDETRAETEAAAAAHQAAVGAYEAATDDLDRAEAHEAVEQAFADHARAASYYGWIRWRAAGLIFNDESILEPSDVGDATLQVAIERALEALRASAERDTLAVFDLAHEATEAAARLSAAQRSYGDESNEAVEAAEPEAAPFDASEAWLKATEAREDAVEAAEDAEDARDAARAAFDASQAAATDARGAAGAIPIAAQGNGDWEAMTTGTQAHLAAAQSSARAAEDFAMKAFEARAAAQAANEAVLAAEQASAAAKAVAERSGATEGEQAYWDLLAKTPFLRFDAENRTRSAARTASGRTNGYVVDAALAVVDAAWYVARIAASVDARGAAAFKESLQQSCR